MAKLPGKVESRISSGLKKYQKLFRDAKDRDVNESDTVLIISDFLNEVLGFDKYTEVTTEYATRGTFVDLAVKLGSEVQYLIEAKAIGVTLRDQHLRQALMYAAQHGIDWVVLTNGGVWQAHKLCFEQPIRNKLVFELDLLSAGHRNADTLEQLFLLSKEGMAKWAIQEFQEQKDACSPFLIAQVLMTEPSLNVIRRELRRISPKAKIATHDISALLRDEVIKRELVDGDEAKAASKRLKQSSNWTLRKAATTRSIRSSDSSVKGPVQLGALPVQDSDLPDR